MTPPTTLKNIVFSMFFNPILARDPPPGHPRDLKFEPGDPSWPLYGPQASFSSIFGLILEVWGPSSGSILASLGHLWAPNASKGDPPSPQKWRKSGVRRPVGQNLQKVSFRMRFFNDFWSDFLMLSCFVSKFYNLLHHDANTEHSLRPIIYSV